MNILTQSGSKLMLFDGVCVFCSRSVQFILNRSDRNRIQFCSMQSERGQRLLSKINMPLEEFKTLVVLEHNHILKKSGAIISLMRDMNRPWPEMALILNLIPTVILDSLYDILAKNRHRILGKSDICYLPKE